MDAIVFAGTAVTWLMGLVVGARLLRIAASTHQTPELTIGVSFLLTAGCGLLPMLLAREVADLPRDLATLLQVFGMFPILAGILAVSLGTWRIFRPRDRWPAVLLVAIWLGTASCATVALAADEHAVFWRWLWNAVATATASWLWMGIEAFLLAGVLSRRARYGLASPEVANRVMLWGVASIAAVTSASLGWIAAGLEPMSFRSAVRITQSSVEWTCVLSMWLAFFPPEAYRRRFTAALRAPAASGT